MSRVQQRFYFSIYASLALSTVGRKARTIVFSSIFCNTLAVTYIIGILQLAT